MRKTISTNSDVTTYQIRAVYDNETIRVYQAYSHEIANTAIANGTFVSPPFSLTRMTWVKPSFLWMMYRCGWAQKDSGQARVLAIDMSRTGFDWALEHACLSACPAHVAPEDWRRRKDASPVVVQWDPEKDIFLKPLAYRSVQIGIGASAVKSYVQDWIRTITDITPLAKEMDQLVKAGRVDDALEMLPDERPYPAKLDHILPVAPRID
ncbi:DUF4291 domain-containing protein [Rhizobium alvei]|uniref:DUF4291 domain-containing protein n=1 Tax=Rhizobium alvei TaxID=1132659 RepID=A0ABT8YNJ4_9HYPH|nr:DUF4291 domain-containing protein [Rhizobium alvei]MDO6965189.1 DUF4291 domain-containing protein [Rhizobium alvei]